MHMVMPGACRTFEGYSQQMFLPYITSQLETVSRVDIVWDRYVTSSLKQTTRDHRRHSGTMLRQRVIAGLPIPAQPGFLLGEWGHPADATQPCISRTHVCQPHIHWYDIHIM